MRLPRHKVLRVQIETLGTSPIAPACEDVQITAVLETSAGTVIERSRIILVYPRIMSDADQFPFLIASELKAMMQAGPA